MAPKSPKTSALVIRVAASSRLPDNDQWENRFLVKSETSDRTYVISQNKTKRHWGCDCPAWRTRRTCKHLNHIGLPSNERPFEAKIEGK